MRERLENMSPIGFDLNGDLLLKSEDYHWLMEQSERVEELEKRIENLNELTDMLHYQYIKLYRQLNQLIRTNQHYKQALEEIKGLYPLRNVGYQVSEIRKIVTKALEEGVNEDKS